MKIHRGGSPLPPIPSGPVHEIGATKTFFSATDMLDYGTLNGVTRFFVFKKDGSEWGSYSHNRDVLGVTVLAAGVEEETWIPVVGAHVVLRAKPDIVALDLYTRGDGATVQLPPMGCALPSGTLFRVEVEATAYNGVLARIVLHGVQENTVR